MAQRNLASFSFIQRRVSDGTGSAMPSGSVQKPVENISGKTYRSAPPSVNRQSFLRMLACGSAHTMSLCSKVIFIPFLFGGR